MRIMPYRTGFYTSLPKSEITQRQKEYAVKTSHGHGWVHLAWIANPDDEIYQVQKREDGKWKPVVSARFGSFLSNEGGIFRVMAEQLDGGKMEPDWRSGDPS